jgi:hypothetical protein
MGCCGWQMKACASMHRWFEAVHCHAGKRMRPCFLPAPGRPSSSPPSRGQAFFPLEKSRGWSTSLSVAAFPHENAGASRRSIAVPHLRPKPVIQAPGPRFLGRGICASPSPASSQRRGHNAPRAESRASRERGYEPRPQAPRRRHPLPGGRPGREPVPDIRHLSLPVTPPSQRLAKTPSMNQADVGI